LLNSFRLTWPEKANSRTGTALPESFPRQPEKRVEEGLSGLIQVSMVKDTGSIREEAAGKERIGRMS
jgi:hypothetical protein